jgi:hypothetical protein
MRRQSPFSFAISALLLCLGFTASAHAQGLSCDLDGVAILATNSARLASDVTVQSGNVVVNKASSGPTLGNGYSLYVDKKTSVAGSLEADTIKIFNQATITGDVSYNQLDNSGTIQGSLISPLALPVFAALPTFHPADPPRGPVSNVVVGIGQQVTLAAGDYGDVTVNDGGKIVFSGGIYNVNSIDVIGDLGSLVFQAPSEVRIRQKFRTRRYATIGPASGFGVTASQIVFYVAGINGSDGGLNSAPEAARIGSDSSVNANFYAPNGTVRLEIRTVATGAFIGRDVMVDSRVAVSLASAFANEPPTAEPQSVDTQGATPIEITLTGSDPEGADLAFAIESGPSEGSLGAVTPIVPPDPGRCSISQDQCFDLTSATDCPLSGETCDPIGDPPPITSATVTYTPNTANDLEDGFTFSVTDPCGSTGMAVVAINPPDDPTPGPPPLTVVDARDVSLETQADIPTPITLLGAGPTGVALTYVVTTLPAGTLTDSNSVDVEAVNTVLPGPNLTYTSPSGFTGSDSFGFEVRGDINGDSDTADAGETDAAVVTILVAALPPLAPDQAVLTDLNQPIAITLGANPGGTGTPINPLMAITAAATLPSAEVAGNVSDSNGDGLGDGRDALPGPAPVFIAAGVDVNLGSPTGTVTDPDSDAGASPNDDPDPDVVFASVSSDGTNLNLQVRFKPGTFDLLLTRAQFLLDTDQNAATGHPGSNAGCVDDAGIIGSEYLINLGADLGTSAAVFDYLGTCNSFGTAGSGSTVFVTDGMDATIPLLVLGGDDGDVNYKVTISEQIGAGPGFTGVLDTMPDLGLAAAQSNVGIRGVARIEIEWPMSGLPTSADEIESAQVSLFTHRGTADSLDTFFSAGTQDQDGVLLESDFQTDTGGVLATMPVPAGSQPGDEGTFSFDATAAVKAAVAAGFNFFTVQGRVDEGLAGQGFQRGLEVRSTATGNQSLGKVPQLQVVLSGTPPPPTLTWTITSLPSPSAGTLTNFATGAPIALNQTFTAQPTLLFTPSYGFTGSTSFNYQVTEGLVVDTALVSILVTINDPCVFNGRPLGCAPSF